MSRSDREFFTDPTRLAEGFLHAHYIWEPPSATAGESLDDGLSPLPAAGQADYALRWWQGGFYRYDAGRYVAVSGGDMERRLVGHLQRTNMRICTADAPDDYVRITTGQVANILLALSGLDGVHLSEDRTLDSWPDGRQRCGITTLSFTNGLLMLDKRSDRPVLVAHTPRFFTLTRLPYAFDPDAACPRWEAFLDDVMEGDADRVTLLQQWAGYLLTDGAAYQKFLLIAGEGRNGKTVFTTLLEKMLGEENVSHIPLSQFAQRFSLAATLGKRLNSTTESTHGLDELAETVLKAFTSGDRMSFERKYREPVHAHPTAKVMVSTNQLPQFADRSQGLWRRLLYVPFERIVDEREQNPRLVDELSRELSGIFNWAWQGAVSLRHDGRFIAPAACRRATEQYRRDVNPARSFLLENYVAALEYEGLPTAEVYQACVQWCRDHGYRPLNASNFGKEVKRTFPTTDKARVRDAGRMVRIYHGLSVIDGSDVARGFCAQRA